ncbi:MULTISPECIES: ferredoxin [unclassified Ruegeria]|uniref:ferredoxin n=1 Tax=unclassified Ruegeria TaxID=2625375 RepID=UPI001488CEF7|nr:MULTISPECIES: ferredoxin [unclassified Ruegeria]
MANLAQPSSDPNAISYDHIVEVAHREGLIVMGALHPRKVEAKQLESGTLVLLGAGGDFWPVLKAAPEWGAPDPVDRWSTRIIGEIAQTFNAEAYFPFGGPPYAPFIDWALKSGRTFSSPVGALVHDTVGMMISYRGALHFAEEFSIPDTPGQSPCITCVAPCTQACPVGALNAQEFYNISACHSHLDTTQGQTCMTGGCLARLACPLSAGAERTSEQSAHHMRSFHTS